MVKEKYLTIPQLAQLLGISRIAVYKKVKKGQIKAVKLGKTYLIADPDIAHILGKELGSVGKKQIDAGVRKVIKEYGELLKKLGKE
jgi:excisionase family DNA binding protein